MGGKIGTIKGLLSLVGAALIVASFGVFVHLVTPMFGVGMQSFLRALIAAILVAGVIIFRRSLAKLTRNQLVSIIIVGLGAFGTFTLFTVSVHTISVGTAMGTLYGCSILSACISGALFLRESFTRIQLIGTLLALIGLGLYASNIGAAGVGIGLLAAVAAGICDGMANCVRKVLKGVDRNTVVMYQSLVSAFGALCVVFFTGEHYVNHASLPAVIGMLSLGLLSIALGSLLLYGFAHFEVHVGAVILSSQVIFAVVLGLFFLHETPTTYELSGCVLVCMGGIVTAFREGKGLAWLERKRVTENV